VKAVQLNDAAADDFEDYFTGLREDQLLYVMPTEKMTIERIMSFGGGRRTIILGKMEERIRI